MNRMNTPTRRFLIGLFTSCLIGSLIAVDSAEAQQLTSADMKEVLSAQQQRIQTISRLSACTIAVFGADGGGGGSGVVISPDGYALTNFHVVGPCGDYMHCGMNDGNLYDAVIVGIDPTGDVALIKLLGRDDFPTAELGDSDSVSIGDWCYVVGNPFLLATNFHPTVTYGIVSGIHRYQYPSGTLLEYADCIQTDASINPGNSGGPLFDSTGRLVGINGRCSFEKRGRVNVGVGYAISINQIKKFYGYLRSGRIVDHATLGATVGSDESGRVMVTDILESSDAFRRGLRYDNEVVELGGKPVRSVNQFKNILGTFPKGWRIPLSYRDDEGLRHDVMVRLAGVHSAEELYQLVERQPRPVRLPKGHPEHHDDDAEDAEGPPHDPPAETPLPERPERSQAPKLPEGAPVPPQNPQQAKSNVPPDVAKLIQPRHGFANDYFNQQNIQRVWRGMTADHDMRGLSDEWILQGTTNGNPWTMILRENESFLKMGGTTHRMDLTADLDEELAFESGEFLLAVSLWRRLLVNGPEKFGDVYYLGTVPPGADFTKQWDVLVATHDVVETQFHVDPRSGKLQSITMFLNEHSDPLELVLQGAPLPETPFPSSLTIKQGDFPELDVQFSALKRAGADAKQEPPTP